jgi:acetyltransferase-like isoleucine patch superfamily enzyme
MSDPDERTGRFAGGVWLDHSTPRGTRAALVLGADAVLRSGTVLYSGSRIGVGFQTGHNVVVREDCLIGDHVSIWSNTVVDYGCTIGDGVKIHCGGYVAQYSRIEEGAFLAPCVVFTNDLYPGREDSLAAMEGPTVQRGAQVGANVTVLPFVTIGAGAMIGAGSVVTRDVPPGMLAYGCPATVVRPVADLGPLPRRDMRSRSGDAVPQQSWREAPE